MKQSFLLPDQGWSQNYCEEIDVILTIGAGDELFYANMDEKESSCFMVNKLSFFFL